jgi:DNA repair protein RadD
MTNEEIARFFNNARPHIQGNPNLRDPQVEGWFPHASALPEQLRALHVQVPVGFGKTGLMALLPFETAQGRVLVIVPNLEIRWGISTAFNVLHAWPACWRRSGEPSRVSSAASHSAGIPEWRP